MSRRVAPLGRSLPPLVEPVLIRNSERSSYKRCRIIRCDAEVWVPPISRGRVGGRPSSRALGFCKRHRTLHDGLRNRYGLSLEDYLEMYREQHGLCAICRVKCKPLTDLVDRRLALVVDHDHTTGAIRDLLCKWCNTGIGHFGENPNDLRDAAEYLERHHA